MSVLNPAKLHVQFQGELSANRPVARRRYTLTHSDRTGDLFLTIGTDFDQQALSEFQTRLMRDEVLAEWYEEDDGQFALHLTCYVSGRWLNFGSAKWRYAIFKQHMPLVLQAMRHGDRALYEAHPALDEAPIYIHFNSHKAPYNKIEAGGKPVDYALI